MRDALAALSAITSLLAWLVTSAKLYEAEGKGKAAALAKVTGEALDDLRQIKATRDKAFADFDAAAANGRLPGDFQTRD